jgi:hypothetical protein
LSARQIEKLQRNGFALNYRHPAAYEISSYPFSKLRNFQKVKKKDILQTHVEFSPAAMKAQRVEGGGRILLGDNTMPGMSCGGDSVSTVLESGFQLDSLVYTYVWPYLYSIPNCAGLCGKQICVSREGLYRHYNLALLRQQTQ